MLPDRAHNMARTLKVIFIFFPTYQIFVIFNAMNVFALDSSKATVHWANNANKKAKIPNPMAAGSSGHCFWG